MESEKAFRVTFGGAVRLVYVAIRRIMFNPQWAAILLILFSISFKFDVPMNEADGDKAKARAVNWMKISSRSAQFFSSSQPSDEALFECLMEQNNAQKKSRFEHFFFGIVLRIYFSAREF